MTWSLQLFSQSIQEPLQPIKLLYSVAIRESPCLWYGSGQVGKKISFCIRPSCHLLRSSVSCRAFASFFSVDDKMKRPLGSLSEAFLDGNIGEEIRELLDNPHVYLRAEGDVQEDKLRTGLEEFLQWGGAHQPSTCRSENSQKKTSLETEHEQKLRARKKTLRV